MKKVLTLVLALVFVLALAAPAMAFTGDTTPAVPVPFTLKIYLVEYSDALFGLGTTLPAADRGYAKNEIVAAVVELFNPKDEILAPTYTNLELSCKNASFNVTDNADGLRHVNDVGAGLAVKAAFEVDSDTKLHRNVLDATPANAIYGVAVAPATFAKTTFKYLVFAKVTGDDASISAKLVEDAAPYKSGQPFKLNGVTYTVTRLPATGAGNYNIVVGTGGDYTDAKIMLYVDGDSKTTGMDITPVGGGTAYPFFIDQVTGLMSIIEAGNIKTSGTTFDAVKKVYDNVAVKVFGFNVALRGNYLRDKFFKDLVSNKTLVAKVDIKPWTAYVKVPDNVVVNPPKTGAAASILGFVMVALAGASAVALKKR